MKKLTLLFLLPAFILLNSCKEEQKKGTTTDNVKIIDLKDFFKNPEKSGYQISPDGKFYSFLAPYQKRMNIFVQEIGKGKKAIQLTKETDRDIAGYFWANDNRIIYLKDDGGDENFYLVGVNKDASNKKELTRIKNVRTQIIDDLEDIPNEMIIGLNKRKPQIFDAYRLNIETGEMKMIAKNPGNIQGWMTDHDGKLRIATTTDGVNTSILYRETEDKEFKNILTTNFKETLNPLFFTFDNKNIYAVSNLGRDKTAIVVFDLKKAKEVEVIYQNKDYDVSGLSYSQKRKVITTASYTSWKYQRHFFDDDTKKMFERLKKEFPDYEIAITSENKNEDKFIIATYSDRSRGTYYFFDLKEDKIEKIIDIAPWLDEKNMAKMKPIQYKSRDGLTIHGYLTIPLEMEEATELPIVVNPHGGPWARDSWGFNPEIQFLANRGYAVFQMNFRGSTGYGREFMEKSFRQWGQAMQNDITDGVKWLIKEGIADEKRIAIYGGSYGGYATLAGLTFTPDLYACGIDYVGVSNLFTFMKTIPPYWEPFLEMMYEMVGNPNTKDSVMMRKYSPVFHVNNIKAPLFVAQGAKDPRVNKDESDQIVEALKKKGVEVVYMVKENEGHGFHNEENKFEFYEAMEKFLANHIK